MHAEKPKIVYNFGLSVCYRVITSMSLCCQKNNILDLSYKENSSYNQISYNLDLLKQQKYNMKLNEDIFLALFDLIILTIIEYKR